MHDFPKRPNAKNMSKQERKLNMYEMPTIAGRNTLDDFSNPSWYKKAAVGGPDMDTKPNGLSQESKISYGNVHGQLMPAVMNTRKRGFGF